MIVLDASALVDLVADGTHKAWVAEQMRDQPVAAPSHQLAEVASAVARLVRAGDLSDDAGRAAVHDAAELPQEVHLLDDDMLARAWEMQDRVRILDGLYVALAARLTAPLVTTDGRLGRARPPCDVRWPASDSD